MNKTLTALFGLCYFIGFGQITTPNDGRLYTLPELANLFPQDIETNEDKTVFTIFADFTLSDSDSLLISDVDSLLLGPEIFLSLQGHINLIDLVISKIPEQERYRGMDIDYSQGNVLSQVIFEEGNGNFIRSVDILFESCIFKNNGHAYRSGALTLSNSNAEILQCTFTSNSRSGINSAANGNASPLIDQCIFERNNTSNGNFPQINLGISNQAFPELPIRITNCTIMGEFPMAGGIAVTNLLGQGMSESIISNCTIKNNRYGIAQLGGFIHGEFHGNTIHNNNIDNDPLTGGSGLNFQGPANNTAVVSGHSIEGNLWGVTVLAQAQPSFGKVEEDGNPGLNVFHNNGNDGNTFALYNNTPDSIWAQNNTWTLDPDVDAEDVIFHQADDEILGLVIFDPVFNESSSTISISLNNTLSFAPNPIRQNTDIQLLNVNSINVSKQSIVRWITLHGTTIHMEAIKNLTKIPVPGSIPPGLYFLQVEDFVPAPIVVIP